jgi:hypothetical protein
MKNCRDTIRVRTFDILARSAVPQPTAPPGAPTTTTTTDLNITLGVCFPICYIYVCV